MILINTRRRAAGAAGRADSTRKRTGPRCGGSSPASPISRSDRNLEILRSDQPRVEGPGRLQEHASRRTALAGTSAPAPSHSTPARTRAHVTSRSRPGSSEPPASTAALQRRTAATALAAASQVSRLGPLHGPARHEPVQDACVARGLCQESCGPLDSTAAAVPPIGLGYACSRILPGPATAPLGAATQGARTAASSSSRPTHYPLLRTEFGSARTHLRTRIPHSRVQQRLQFSLIALRTLCFALGCASSRQNSMRSRRRSTRNTQVQ